MDFLKKYEWKNIFKDVTNEQGLYNLVNSDKTFYVGIDPTGSDLHLGHILSFISVKLIQEEFNINPIFVIGGFTGSIGDPSGKNSERSVLDKEVIQKNLESLKSRIKYIADKLKITNYQLVNNDDFYKQLSISDFFRDFGKYMNLNHMLKKDMIQKRLDVGISYTEFSYQLFQAIDFYQLNSKYNCFLQIGGSDQWGNIVSGIDLIKKLSESKEEIKKYEPIGLTTNLILDSNGNKIGKSEGKPIWVNPNKISSYFLHQYFLNLDDETAKTMLSSLTLISRESFDNICQEFETNPKSKPFQNGLSKEFISLFYDQKAYQLALEISDKLFNKKYDELNDDNVKQIIDSIPTFKINPKELFFDKLISLGLISSKRELKEFISQKAIKLNNQTLTEENINSIFEMIMKNLSFIEKKILFLDIGKKKKNIILID